MKFSASRLATLAGATLLVAATAAFGQDPTAGKVAVIDLQAAMVSTQEGQSAAAKLQSEFFQPENAKLEAMQRELQDLSNRLSQGANTLSETAQADLQREIDAKNKVLTRAIEDFQLEGDEQQRLVLDDLTSKMRSVLDTYLTSNGYTLLLDARNPNSGLVWASETIDITPEIIEAYDKLHPAAAPAASTPGTPANGAAAAPEIPVAPGTPAN